MKKFRVFSRGRPEPTTCGIDEDGGIAKRTFAKYEKCALQNGGINRSLTSSLG